MVPPRIVLYRPPGAAALTLGGLCIPKPMNKPIIVCRGM